MTGHAPPGPQQGVATSAYSSRCKNARSPISYTFAQAKTGNNKVLRTWYCNVNHKLAMLVRPLDATTRRYVHSNISHGNPLRRHTYRYFNLERESKTPGGSAVSSFCCNLLGCIVLGGGQEQGNSTTGGYQLLRRRFRLR